MASCRDAQDAVRGRDGYDFFGNRIRVELSNGSRDPGRGGGRGGGGGGGGGGGPPQTFRGRGTGFRALVKGLPISCSWQDLKVGWGCASGHCLCCLAGEGLPICGLWPYLQGGLRLSSYTWEGAVARCNRARLFWLRSSNGHWYSHLVWLVHHICGCWSDLKVGCASV